MAWLCVVLLGLGLLAITHTANSFFDRSEFESISDLGGGQESLLPSFIDPYANWVRPPGPIRIGIQAGHWKSAELPEELQSLRTRTGTQGGGTTEWELNLEVAEQIKPLLEAEGMIVDLLPATIPPGYWADLFIALRADGSTDPRANGFKIAGPWRDRTGKSAGYVPVFEAIYASSTKLAHDAENVTANMRGYYAFNGRRYRHAIHPMTPALIIEMGFLTNPGDARYLTRNQAVIARAIADGVRAVMIEPSH
jgi:N-acetylmuramoyl-L-alanine amidase